MPSHSEFRPFPARSATQCEGLPPDDNYFHLAPQRKKVVTFSAIGLPQRNFKADVEALNVDSSQTIALRKGRA